MTVVNPDSIAGITSVTSSGTTLEFYDVNGDKLNVSADLTGSFTVGTGATINSPAANIIDFETNGEERLRIKSNGFVGIGTDNPTRFLHLQDDSNTLLALDSTDSNADLVQSDTGGSTRIRSVSGALEFFAGGDASSTNATGSGKKLHITSTGLVDVAGNFVSSCIGNIDPDSYNQHFITGNIGDGSGWGVNGIAFGAGTGDMMAIGHNGNAGFFGMQDGSTNSMETFIKFSPNASVGLYYNGGTAKFETTSSGISVTGEVASSQDYPDFRPALDLNFEAVQKLDSRITYTRTGPASYVDENGLVVLVGDNAPRFDHSFPEFWDEGNVGDTNSVGVPKGLLMEESRTNIFKNNHSLSTVNDHADIGYALNTTETTAPDGTFTATKVTGGGTNKWTRWDTNNGLDISTINFTDTFTISVYAKTVGTSNANLTLDFGDQGSKAFSVGQDWKRYAISAVHHDYGATTKFIDLSFGGDIYIWGLQCEKGSFLTSYIPTNGSTATRGEDSLVIDGDDFNEFFDHTGAAIHNYTGTLLSFMKFDDIKYIPTAGRSNRVQLELNNDNKVQLSTVGGGSPYVDSVVTYGTSNQADFTGSSGSTFPNMLKHGISFAKDNFAYSYNGNTVETDTSGNVGGTSASLKYTKLSIGDGPSKVHMKRIIYYADRLSNSQLVTLTS